MTQKIKSHRGILQKLLKEKGILTKQYNDMIQGNIATQQEINNHKGLIKNKDVNIGKYKRRIRGFRLIQFFELIEE